MEELEVDFTDMELLVDQNALQKIIYIKIYIENNLKLKYVSIENNLKLKDVSIENNVKLKNVSSLYSADESLKKLIFNF